MNITTSQTTISTFQTGVLSSLIQNLPSLPPSPPYLPTLYQPRIHLRRPTYQENISLMNQVKKVKFCSSRSHPVLRSDPPDILADYQWSFSPPAPLSGSNLLTHSFLTGPSHSTRFLSTRFLRYVLPRALCQHFTASERTPSIHISDLKARNRKSRRSQLRRTTHYARKCPFQVLPYSVPIARADASYRGSVEKCNMTIWPIGMRDLS